MVVDALCNYQIGTSSDKHVTACVPFDRGMSLFDTDDDTRVEYGLMHDDARFGMAPLSQYTSIVEGIGGSLYAPGLNFTQRGPVVVYRLSKDHGRVLHLGVRADEAKKALSAIVSANMHRT